LRWCRPYESAGWVWLVQVAAYSASVRSPRDSAVGRCCTPVARLRRRPGLEQGGELLGVNSSSQARLLKDSMNGFSHGEPGLLEVVRAPARRRSPAAPRRSSPCRCPSAGAVARRGPRPARTARRRSHRRCRCGRPVSPAPCGGSSATCSDLRRRPSATSSELEVEGPHLGGPRGPQQLPATIGAVAAFARPDRTAQHVLAPQLLHPLVIHPLPRLGGIPAQHPPAPPRMPAGDPTQLRPQPRLLGRADCSG
jgi:hypothetical protein